MVPPLCEMVGLAALWMNPAVTGTDGTGRTDADSCRSVPPGAFCMLRQNNAERSQQCAGGSEGSVATSRGSGCAMRAGFERAKNGVEELQSACSNRGGTKARGRTRRGWRTAVRNAASMPGLAGSSASAGLRPGMPPLRCQCPRTADPAHPAAPRHYPSGWFPAAARRSAR